MTEPTPSEAQSWKVPSLQGNGCDAVEAAWAIERRSVLSLPLIGLLFGGTAASAANAGNASFAYVSRITVKPGKEAEYARVVERDTGRVPGCLFFSVCRDPANPRSFWTIEFWDSQASFDRAMKMPKFKETITRAAPLAETYERIATLAPSIVSRGGR